MKRIPCAPLPDAELRRRAEAGVKRRPARNRASPKSATQEEEPKRLLHELQVHQIELEMQNVELQAARNRSEDLLEKFTDLYDFAPVGFFSVDEQSRILEANLTGAAVLGMDRSRLMKRRLASFVEPASRPAFLNFLERTFEEPADKDNVCEVILARNDGTRFWARFNGTTALPYGGDPRQCRVAVSDITQAKQAEEVVRRNEVLFSELIEQAPLGIFVVDASLRLQQVNPTAQPVFKNIPNLIGGTSMKSSESSGRRKSPRRLLNTTSRR